MKKIASFLIKSNTGFVVMPFFLLAFVLFFMASCVKNYFDLDKIADSKWTPKVAVPMVYSSLSINDIIKAGNGDDLFHIGSDNFVTLVYRGNLFSVRGEDLIQLPDNPNSQNIFIPGSDIPAITSGGTVTFSSNQQINFVTDGQTMIDSIIYKSGILQMDLSSNIQHNIKIVISIPSLKKNGVPYSTVFFLDYVGSLPVIASAPLDLSGYTLDMTYGGGQNQFMIYFTVTATGIPPNPLSPADNISIGTNFKDNRFDKIFGYIGQRALTSSSNNDTVPIGLFNNSIEVGTFTLVDAKIKAIISNSYGMPIFAKFDSLQGYNPGAGTFDVTGSGVPNPIPMPNPSLSQLGQVLKDSFELNNTNSNVVQLINFQPKYFVYQLYSQSNPSGPPASNFVIDTSIFSVDVDIELPLHGTAVIFTVQDTFDFEMPEGDDLDSLLLRIWISNGFPLEVGVQVYFVNTIISPVDTVYTVVDSVLSPFQNILTSAPIDGNGKAIGAVEKTIDQWFDAKKLKNIANSNSIFVRGQMTTSNNGNINVKIYTDYKLDIKIGAMAKLNQTVSFH